MPALRRSYTAADRLAAISTYESRHDQGWTVEQVCAATGVPKPTLLRWVAEAGAEAQPAAPIGRKPSHVFSEAEAAALQHLRLKHRSLAIAVSRFLTHEACSRESHDFLSRLLERSAVSGKAPSWPPCLRAAAHLPEEIESSFRGAKALTSYAPSIARGAFWIDASGREIELHAHDIWESDDMSVNEPFRHVDPISGETRIGRQILFTSDRQSAAMLGLTLIGRDRDAYRSEDILDHMLDLIDLFGLPRLWRLERGVWESKGIDGCPLDDARARELGYLGERWEGRRIGGLDHLFRLEHCYSSNGKGGIESTFNHFQNLSAHDSLHIGRERGEFEGAARELRRAQAGMADAQAKFWEASECAARLIECAGEFNNSPKARAMYGGKRLVPNDLLRASTLPKRSLPDSERWRFQPRKQLAVVQKGLISVTVDGQKFTWAADGDGIGLDHGHRVVIAFHPQHPERGCTVVEAEFGPRNRDRRPIGEPLFVTMPLELRPQWDERPADERGTDQHPAQRFRGRVRREFRAIVGGEAASKSHLSDGRGRSATIESGFGQDRAAQAADPTPSRRHTAPAVSARSTTPIMSAEDLEREEADALKFL